MLIFNCLVTISFFHLCGFCYGKTTIERYTGIDFIYDKELKIKSADVFVDKKLYFLVVLENGRSSLKALNYSKKGAHDLMEVLQFPVRSAQTVAVDWVNGNLYWADKVNKFFEVVDISQGISFPLQRKSRRILLSQEIADIDSMVVDPWEQYIFWLHIGGDMVLERARLDGLDRIVIYKSIQYKSSSLAIDRHTKMLFWLGISSTIHRVDYQGRSGCTMELRQDWKNWKPTIFVFSESRLIFINNEVIWTVEFNCGQGIASQIERSSAPSAVVAIGYQLARPGTTQSRCPRKNCHSICLPSADSSYQCTCSTGINYDSIKAMCPLAPSKSLFIGSPPRIYQLSLDNHKMHMDPIFEDAGVPLRLAYDPFTSSILYIDHNSSSIHVFDINGHKPSVPLIYDSPAVFQEPSTFAIDSASRNIYWMNYQTSELWVARITTSFHLKNTALLLSWKKDTFPANRLVPIRGRQANLPGEIAVDSHHRYLFVSVIRDGHASIERYWLDGSNKFVVVQSPNIVSPRGLSFDPIKQDLFFVDTTRDEMISIGYNGNDFHVIEKRFPDFFGLTFLDGYIYWTDLDTLTVNRVRQDGKYRSSIASTHNLRVVTMPIVAMTTENSSLTNSPCNSTANGCDQLCFPTRSSRDSYSCGCASTAYVLVNIPRCSNHGLVALLFNSSYIELLNVLGTVDRKTVSLFKLDSEVLIASVQVDMFRNFIYWIDKTNNCIEKAVIESQSKRISKIICLTTDEIVSISIDSNRNNLYVSIKSDIWSRIELIRLPFHNDDVLWRRVFISNPDYNIFMGPVIVHPGTSRIFWFSSVPGSKYGLVGLYQADLDGKRQTLLFKGFSSFEELVIDINGLFLYWKNSDSKTIYKFDVTSQEVQELSLSADLLRYRSSHISACEGVLYLSLNASVFILNISSSKNWVTQMNMTSFLNFSRSNSLDGFIILPQNMSNKVALIKTYFNLGTFVMCPNMTNDKFSVCGQFCLPSEFSNCSCGSAYSLMEDGFTCSESKNHLLVLTSSGEVIGLEVASRLGKLGEFTDKEWIEIAEHKLSGEQKLVDAVYWNSKNIILFLDNEGRLIGKHRSWPYNQIKNYKRLSITRENGDNVKTISAYERVYRYFLQNDYAYKDHYESSRYSIALDPISDTFIWSDWVNGVIVAEKLNSRDDSVDFVGIVIDFRQSSRRPLTISVAPISSSILWISADLAINATNGSSIWKNFWIELSDMDGSRRTVLVKEPGVPSCLTVDVHTGRVYWIDRRKNILMYLHVHWDNYQIKANHVIGRRLKVTVNSISSTGISYSSSAMTVLKKHLIFADWNRQIIINTSLDSGESNLYNNNRASTEKIQLHQLPYIKQKLKNVVKLIGRLGVEDFRKSSVGSLLQNHPCSHVKDQLCSHLCLSTIPISLAEEYSTLMTAKQLGETYRCACPYDMAVKYRERNGLCLNITSIKCQKNEILCKAGRVFIGTEKVVAQNCLSEQKQCDMLEDCLDGSDETGCSHCNISHPYSCSVSGICMNMKNRCDGVVDCDSDEKCCDNNMFECLTGNGPGRCIHISERCNGFRNCKDGSDEIGCDFPDNPRKSSSDNEYTVMRNIRDNHLVAIITGCVALLAFIMAVLYIGISRRNRNKTVHESCMFRANNVNIMLMSYSSRAPRHHRSQNDIFQTKSCDIIDVSRSYHESEPLTHSLTSLSDIYQRIRDPHPDKFSALKMPLFTIQDDILFNFNRFQRVQDPYSDSNEKLENPPPSEVTSNSQESLNILTETIAVNQDNVMRSPEIMTPCESELEEIYFHRYRSYSSRSPNFQNYPSRLLQMLLTSNHSNYLQDSHSKPLPPVKTVQPNYHDQRRRKLFRHQKRHKSWKTNMSLSPRRKLYCSHESLTIPNISPPPPSPITVVSS